MHNKIDIPYDIIMRPETTIIDVFSSNANAYPHYTAIMKKIDNKWKSISYFEFHNICKSVAHKLLYFVGPHPDIGLFSHQCPMWTYLHIGTMMANGITHCLDMNIPINVLSDIINKSNIELIACTANQLETIMNLKMQTVKIILLFDSFSSEIEQNVKKINSKIKVMAFDNFVCASISTTTTTTTIDIPYPTIDNIACKIFAPSKLKKQQFSKISISHGNIMNTLSACLYTLQSRSNINIYLKEKFTSYLDFNSITSMIFNCYLPIACIGATYYCDYVPGTYPQFIKDVNPTIFVADSTIWNIIMEHIIHDNYDPNGIINKLFMNNLIIRDIGLHDIKWCVNIGPDLSNNNMRVFLKTIGIELCNAHCMNETTGPIAIGVPGFSKGIGVPVCDIKIDHDTSNILVKGKSILSNNTKNEWYNTEITGIIHRDGTLHINNKNDK